MARASSRLPISRHGTEYKVRPTITCASGATLGRLQVAGSNGCSGSGSSAGASAAVNTSATVRPSSGRGRRCPATWTHQASASAVIAARRRPAAPGEEAGADIPLVRLDDSLVPGMIGPGRVDQAPVVGGQLGIAAVDLRVIQVRLAHPGLEVVRHQPPRRPAEELERGHVRLDPGPLGHAHRRADEQVPRVRQHHRERPHPPPPARRRVRPQPHVPVIHLGLGARRHRRPGHPDLLRPGPVREMRPHVAAHAGHARLQALLGGQPLVDHRHRHHADELRRSGRDAARSPATTPAGPRCRRSAGTSPGPAPATAPRLTGGPPGRHPGRLRRRHVPADGLDVHPQAARDLDLRPPRIPVLQDLRDIDHRERPPCHLGPPSEADEEHTQLEGPEAEPPCRQRLGKTLIEGVGNYLIAAGP